MTGLHERTRWVATPCSLSLSFCLAPNLYAWFTYHTTICTAALAPASSAELLHPCGGCGSGIPRVAPTHTYRHTDAGWKKEVTASAPILRHNTYCPAEIRQTPLPAMPRPTVSAVRFDFTMGGGL
eukprot:6887233-Prymnesium_polylepis.1